MRYNPDIHHRHSTRLEEYDYSSEGLYFITICTQNRELFLKKYPELFQLIEKQWLAIPNRYENVELDEYVIMPNHLHGIIFLKPHAVGAGLAPALVATKIGEIIATFKSLCIHDWLMTIKQNNINALGKFWQRNYHDRIIRNEKELFKIREYIRNNPFNWENDIENPNYRK